MSDAYPLAMSTNEIERLRMQGDLFRHDADQMLTEIGVQPGWRCLDLCCGVGGITDLLSMHTGPSGEVVGLDLDASKLDVAAEWATALGLTNVQYVQGDAYKTGLPHHSFDLVHARFALGIIPDGNRIVEQMLELARPGGVVFLQEADIDGFCCFPEHSAWELALNTIATCFDRIGSDLRIGRKLYAMLRAADLRDFKIRPIRYAIRSGEPMANHLPLTLTAMRESIVSLGLMDAAQLEKTASALMNHLADPGTLTVSYTMMQVSGRLRQLDNSKE